MSSKGSVWRSRWLVGLALACTLWVVPAAVRAQAPEPGATAESEEAAEPVEPEDAAEPVEPAESVERDTGAEGPTVTLRSPVRGAPRLDLWQADDALMQQGWQFERQEVVRGSATAGLLALTVGSLWHGVGHFAVGDRPTMWRLLAVEAAALGLAASGVLTQALGEGEGARAAGRVLNLAAASLFLGSWVADVVGTVKGNGSDLSDNTMELRGLALEAYYTLLLEEGLDINNVGVGRMSILSGRLVALPEIEFQTDLNYLGIGAYAGYRHPLSRFSRQTFVEFGGGLREDRVRAWDYGRTQLRTRAMVSMDLGVLVPHLSGLVWRNAVEVTADHTWLDNSLRSRFAEDARTWTVPFEFLLSGNISRYVNVQASYRSRPDLLVGQSTPDFGVVSGRVSVVPVNRLGIDLQLDYGAFVRLWAGVRYVIAGSRRVLESPSAGR